MKRYYNPISDSTSNTNIDDLPWDPAERKEIASYHPNQRDEIRRKYLVRGPYQPYGHDFKKTQMSNALRRFNRAWFEKYSTWVEYSILKERAFCLFCYLFKDDVRKLGGSDVFVKEGFCSWNKPDRLDTHVGKPNSTHNCAAEKCDNLMNQGQFIKHALFKQNDVVKNEYRIRLNASIDVSRYLLRQGLSFRGHDESEGFANRENFLELVKYTGEQNVDVSKVILKNAPQNNQMICPKIQKEIVNSFAEEVVKSIIEEIDHGVFGLLVDESSDVSHKEQMAVVFRFVDKSGTVKERFIGVVHVKETSSASLKSAIDNLFAKYGLSLKKLRGQGYDGASNMKGEFNGLRALVVRENNAAYYVHCFPHQLQLVVVQKSTLRKDQDILNAMSLVESTKGELQKLRDDGWDSLMNKVSSFCEKHNAEMLVMEDVFVDPMKPRRKTNITNLHHYKVNCFYTIIDLQFQEFNDRFTEVNTDLLICMASLSPLDSFHEFDKEKLVRLVKFYPDDFSYGEILSLEQHLDIYIDNMRRDERFKSLKSLGDLSRLMVKTQKHLAHPLVYRLLKLVLTLSVATASVERCFFCNEVGEDSCTQ
ncbi:Zinc finger TTF-type [Arabidopsis thaliana x Arabidopsis arenosa]|uniref:Zinc finger TTF-type n=1 Tax=Arabidopsis thaliana x Arabidopsis arenosa TaxID=1240361 RepID=A0A8T1ZQ88_9BRAS|nr:Zinc finger TTF-type [Arabidopsis thaliana x Arabidopsis arenosa]